MYATTIHRGSHASIPSTSSPGLLFLKALLPVLDSLEAEDAQKLPALLHPEATFTLNNAPSSKAGDVLGMFAARSAKVCRFGHDTHVSWDIAGEDGGRTVMYESTSFTVFRDDEEGVEVEVREFNVVELVMCDGVLKAREVRTYMDPSPVSARAQAVMAKKGV